jgi:hypothetical protein
MPLFGNRRIKREMNARVSYLLALGDAFVRGMDQEHARAHARTLTSYTYFQVPETLPLEFEILYCHFRKHSLGVERSIELASQGIGFFGPYDSPEINQEVRDYFLLQHIKVLPTGRSNEGLPVRLEYLREYAWAIGQDWSTDAARIYAQVMSECEYEPSPILAESESEFISCFSFFRKEGFTPEESAYKATKVTRYSGELEPGLLPSDLNSFVTRNGGYSGLTDLFTADAFSQAQRTSDGSDDMLILAAKYLYTTQEEERIKYLCEFADNLAVNGALPDTDAFRAKINSDYQYQVSDNLYFRQFDFLLLYDLLTKRGFPLIAAVSLSFQMSRFNGPWSDPELPEEVRDSAPYIIAHLHRWRERFQF